MHTQDFSVCLKIDSELRKSCEIWRGLCRIHCSMSVFYNLLSIQFDLNGCLNGLFINTKRNSTKDVMFYVAHRYRYINEWLCCKTFEGCSFAYTPFAPQYWCRGNREMLCAGVFSHLPIVKCNIVSCWMFIGGVVSTTSAP